jgi:hypothetical protein
MIASIFDLWSAHGIDFLWMLGHTVLLVAVLLGSVALLTYVERKVLAAMQKRQGPMTVGPFGLLQALADGIKLFSKETIVPTQANRAVFFLAPILLMTLALVAWAVIPVNAKWVLADLNVGVLYLFAVSSMGVYGVIMAGWASNSKYAFLGGDAFGLANGVLRSLYGAGDSYRDFVCGIDESFRNRDRAASGVDAGSFVTDACGVSGFHPRGNQSPAVRLAGRGVGTIRRLYGRIFFYDLCPVLSWRIRQYDSDERDDDHPVPWRVAAAVRDGGVGPGSRRDLVCGEGLCRLVLLYLGAGNISTLSL